MIAHTPPTYPPEHAPGARAFGATIRGRRLRAHCTLRLCAELVGMSMTDLSAVEQGARGFTPDERERFEAVIRSRNYLLGEAKARKAVKP